MNVVSLRMQQIGQSVFSAIDRANCDWREEYRVALAILESAFERVPAEGREFLLEKFTQEDLPRVVGLRGCAFHRGAPLPLNVSAVN